MERLHRQGVRVDAIGDITSDLNDRLHAKLFEIVAPPSIREAGCLMLMGSEGRGEQTVRTDQDNGLFWRTRCRRRTSRRSERFLQALEAFGFPLAPATSWCAILCGRSRSMAFSAAPDLGSYG